MAGMSPEVARSCLSGMPTIWSLPRVNRTRAGGPDSVEIDPFQTSRGKGLLTSCAFCYLEMGSFLNEPEVRLCRAIAVAAGVVGAALIPIRVSDRPLSSEKLVRL
jgi:hypothetical protein